MAWLTAFGALAVTLMLLCYALEPRHAAFVLAFARACVASSAYGFLQGAWPFGVVELVWAGVAFRRWRTRVTRAGTPADEAPRRAGASYWREPPPSQAPSHARRRR